jgi:hypothetical protein
MTETELVERLERLERAHRRLKGFALAALVLATALATIYATQPVPQTITAHQFNVVDGSGKVRVSMGGLQGQPMFGFSVYDAQGKPGVSVVVSPSGAIIDLGDAQGLVRTKLNVTPEGESSIALSDPQGFEMDLGSTKTVMAATGATERTSVASIAMFANDKERHVIWKVP